MRTMLTSAVAICAALGVSAPAAAQQDPFLGQVTAFGFGWCPRNWAPAHGQLLQISQNTALFALYGTAYGGNGITDFGLPDMRGRSAVSVGQSPGQPTSYQRGQYIGYPEVVLNASQLANHTHNFNASSASPDTLAINNATFATYPVGQSAYASPGALTLEMNPDMVGNTGASTPFAIRQPYLAINYCVALEGVFPPRN